MFALVPPSASAPAVDVPTCPVCGDGRRRRLPTPGHRIDDARFAACAPPPGLVACRGCGFVFVSPRPDDATLAAFYDAQRPRSRTRVEEMLLVTMLSRR